MTRFALVMQIRTLVALNRLWLRFHPETKTLYESGVFYRREMPGREEWFGIPAVIEQGWADCEDLAAWRVAELLEGKSGYDPDAKPWFRVRKIGDSYRGHVIVKRGDGSFEDPSIVLGMGSMRDILESILIRGGL